MAKRLVSGHAPADRLNRDVQLCGISVRYELGSLPGKTYGLSIRRGSFLSVSCRGVEIVRAQEAQLRGFFCGGLEKWRCGRLSSYLALSNDLLLDSWRCLKCLRIHQRLADSVQVRQWKTVHVQYASGRAKFW